MNTDKKKITNIKTRISKIIFVVFCFFACFFLFQYGSAHAALTKEISYQGKLTDTNDAAVNDTSYDFTFAIYDSATNGNCLWTARGTCGSPDTRPVSVSKGIFSIMLGDTAAGDNALNLDFNSPYYLSIKIGTDSEMTPRKKLGASGYAFNSNKLNGLDSSQFANLTGQAGGQTLIGGTNSNNILTLQGNSATGNANTNIAMLFNSGNNGATNAMTILNNGNVGIGTTNPTTNLDINGVTNVTTGYRVAGGATSGAYLRGDGTNFVSSMIQATDVPTLNQSTTGNAATATNLTGLTATITNLNSVSGLLGTAAFTASSAYATAAQGTLATNALPSASFTDAAVTGKLITGYVSGTGAVAATDTLLQAIQKLNGNDSLKANLASPTFTGTVSGITATMVGLGNVPNLSFSGSNTGDNAVNSLYSSLVSNATHTGDATGSTALTVVKINGTQLSSLATGILKNSTGTGVPSIAIASDFPTLNQSTTGNAATATSFTNWYNGGSASLTNLTASSQLISNVATGTAPIQVASTTKVASLNADLLDGFDSSAFGDATAANQTTILNRIGTNADAASMSTTLFAGQQAIYDTLSGMGSGGGSWHSQAFSSNGAWTYPSPAPSEISVFVVGAGGGGAGSVSGNGFGGGGGGGAMLFARDVPVTGNVTITIGTAGSAGAAGGGAGGTGGTTTVSQSGTPWGVSAPGGGGGSCGAWPGGPGGAGGSVSEAAGGAGASTIDVGGNGTCSSFACGGGGGSVARNGGSAGIAYFNTGAVGSGNGGNYGSGGGSSYGNGGSGISCSGTSGTMGGGGGGGCNGASSPGGAGGSGYVIIYYKN